MERLSQRKFWLIFSFIVGVSTVLIGKIWLFQDSNCSRLQDILLYSVATFFVVVYFFFILITNNDSLLMQVISLFIEGFVILAITSVLGSVLGGIPKYQTVFCNVTVCNKSGFAESMRKDGNLDAAEQISRTCIVDVTNKVIPESCMEECSRELSYTLFDKAGSIINNLQGSLTLDTDGQCEAARNYLEEAESVITRFEFDDLTKSIQERKSRLLDKCVIVKEPTPTIQSEVLRSGWDVNRVYFDVRVMENNEFLPRIASSDILVTLNGETIPFTLEEKSSDDNLCLVMVVDNSGSIYEGLDGIRSAIQKVNDSRKPMDELGMVVFSSRDKIGVVQSPGDQSLDTMSIDGQGQMTALWDGLSVGLDTTASCKSELRYLLVLTDGKDNDSIHLEGDEDSKARTIAERAASEGVNICTIGITNKVDESSLKLVSTGCGYQYAENYDTVADQLQNLFGYVYGFYRVTLNPADVPIDSQLVLRIKNTQGVTVDFK